MHIAAGLLVRQHRTQPKQECVFSIFRKETKMESYFAISIGQPLIRVRKINRAKWKTAKLVHFST